MAQQLTSLRRVGVVAICALAVAAAPRATPTSQWNCPTAYTSTFTQTLSIIAPTTTGPFETTTGTATGWLWPWVTATETITDAEGDVYADVFTYSNYDDFPPYPSDCSYWQQA
ncbi:uncharacterized protein C8Q71DRAFT_855865 [Rhodofomes roseus]|uniref:Secreted protein n=1 Tax=Rhodofomes roseus TaxID=34475 RepID=A0ABQ8KLP4_9APHY|nr:uncharacterized protein C8Q71DRAFT_855865 [Rhodofomes roseus]KAH9839232.1 hypothetical protein C8Q71DRAFT_855865 [Rhodofomes roseus]